MVSFMFAVPCSALSDGWYKNKDGSWSYVHEGEWLYYSWLTLDDDVYYIDTNGIMKTGWVKDAGYWYYMDGSGAMVKNKWVKSSGKWYYLGFSGVMLTNAVTPDGYTVDENGVWLEHIPVKSTSSL